MKKRKVKKLTVVWDNGESDEFEVDATFSESINSRKKYGYSNLEEWVEYHITWIQYIRDLPPVEKTKTSEELEAESLARVAEKRKNPLYAGTQDGKDFYHQPLKPKQTWEQFWTDFSKESRNGQ